MQATAPPRRSRRAQVATYILRALLLLFGALVLVSHSYIFYVNFSAGTIANAHFILPAVTVVPFVLGRLIERRHPGHTIALLFLIMAYSSGVSAVAVGRGWLAGFVPVPYLPHFESIMLVLNHVAWLPGVVIPLFLMPLYFPTGRLLSPRWRLLVLWILLAVAWTAVTVALRPWPWPLYDIVEARAFNGISGSEPVFDAVYTVVGGAFVPVFPLVGLAGFLRYRRSHGVERIQMKWPLFAIACFVCIAALLTLFPALLDHDQPSGYMITWSLAMLFPLSIGVAILRHRLWDIDLLINRTLVYATLTALIVALYAALVGMFGTLFQSGAGTVGGLLAAGVIAVLFQPLRHWLQRRANRLLYGERDNPAAVLARLARHMETSPSTADILPNLLQTVAAALRIPYVAIRPAGQEEPVAAWGEAPAGVQAVPLIYGQETLGHLLIAPRGPGERFNRHERELLATIAALAASTVRAVELSDDVRRSRRRIVAAREEERRRIRRDLHDGLGPQLASQTLGMEAVSQLIPREPERAQALLDSLKRQAEEATRDVRRLVYGLRPPALDDLGLAGALERFAATCGRGALQVTLDLPADLPPLPAAVEVAVFRMAQEAMTNVLRHSEATDCIVRLGCAEKRLVLQVRDDGNGLDPNQRAGVGLRAMHERAAELNGRVVLQSPPGGGVLVEATLPLESDDV